MEQIKGPDAGTCMPKHIYDMNQKTEELHDFANGLLPDSNDLKILTRRFFLLSG